MHVCNIIIYR